LINLIYDAQTKETTTVDMPYIEMPVVDIPQEPTEADRLDALEDAMLFII
jgi:hypothetical protein